jgi:hypothetical protein
MINLPIPSFNQPTLKSLNNPNPLPSPDQQVPTGISSWAFPYAFPFNNNVDFDRLVYPQAPLSFAYLF